MILRKQPNQWTCLLTAYAMCLDVEPQTLISEIGHDGSDIVWPTLKEPLCRRAFHVQELNLSCLRRGYAPIWWDNPMLSRSCEESGVLEIAFDMEKQVKNSFSGVVFIGNHAWAWSGRYLYNPAGYVEEQTKTKVMLQNVRTFCQLLKIRSD